jgi:hypothetical protein
MTLLCNKIIVAKSKEVKTDLSVDTPGKVFQGMLWLEFVSDGNAEISSGDPLKRGLKVSDDDM